MFARCHHFLESWLQRVASPWSAIYLDIVWYCIVWLLEGHALLDKSMFPRLGWKDICSTSLFFWHAKNHLFQIFLTLKPNHWLRHWNVLVFGSVFYTEGRKLWTWNRCWRHLARLAVGKCRICPKMGYPTKICSHVRKLHVYLYKCHYVPCVGRQYSWDVLSHIGEWPMRWSPKSDMTYQIWMVPPYDVPCLAPKFS